MLHRVALTMMLMAALQVPVQAQSSSRALVRSDPRGQYALLRDLYSQAYAAKPVKIDPAEIDLIECGTDPPAVAINSALENYDEAVRPLAQAAYDVVHTRALLTAAGYPERVWGGLLEQFEQRQLALVIVEVRNYVPGSWGGDTDRPSQENARRFYDRLGSTLNAYRRSSGGGLPPVNSEGGCGAGEVSVLVKVVPADGSVLFIPKFFYQFCQKQGVNPADRQGCVWWREASDGELKGLAGDYVYRAIWPDGRTRDGSISFNSSQDGRTFVIRHP